MATPFQLIYKKFLNLIDDYELNLITDEELNEVLFGYLDEARSLYFQQCRKDLEKIVEDTENVGLGEFVDNLTSQEQYILALGMKKAWLSPKLHNADLMSREIGDRDYKVVQGKDYLKELSNLNSQIEYEIWKYTKDYSWKDFSAESW